MMILIMSLVERLIQGPGLTGSQDRSEAFGASDIFNP